MLVAAHHASWHKRPKVAYCGTVSSSDFTEGVDETVLIVSRGRGAWLCHGREVSAEKETTVSLGWRARRLEETQATGSGDIE